jgi:hypothetical protein
MFFTIKAGSERERELKIIRIRLGNEKNPDEKNEKIFILSNRSSLLIKR